jgi:pimeloyl-ACP methyl ester carboxylesterase
MLYQNTGTGSPITLPSGEPYYYDTSFTATSFAAAPTNIYISFRAEVSAQPYRTPFQFSCVVFDVTTNKMWWQGDSSSLELNRIGSDMLNNFGSMREFDNEDLFPSSAGTADINVGDTMDIRCVGSAFDTYELDSGDGTNMWGSVQTDSPLASNVLFLPGIEGSRLYEGTGCDSDAVEEKLWEPYDSLLSAIFGAGDDKVRNLFLNSSGESVCDDVYVKDGDIIDSADGDDIYQSFIDEMNELKADSIINDWKPVAYDWRLSLNDLLNNGAERDGEIYYEDATDTPYIEQTLRELAATSKTGKVTIVAHSNGGLVAKALLNKLGDAESAALVDKVILVGAPQSGAPEDLGTLLEGYDAGIYKYGFPIVSDSVMQELAQNSPAAYHLPPSQDYFSSIAGDTNHPVASFEGDAYVTEEGLYGNTITDAHTLDEYLSDSPQNLNKSLIDYANNEHNTLDNWTPPAGIEVDQIAGWGVDTVAGIDFYTMPLVQAFESLHSDRVYKPIVTEDGDGTVPIPSALMMASSTEVQNYWLNLDAYHKATSVKRTHADLFEVPSLDDFIKGIIENSVSILPAYISTSQPPPLVAGKELTFFLHSSQLALQLTDSSGNVTGAAPDNSIAENIPGSTFGTFGDVEYVTVPEGDTYQVTVQAQQNQQSQTSQTGGALSLDVQETSGGVVTVSNTILNISATTNTSATLEVLGGGVDTISDPVVNENECVEYHRPYAHP